MTRLVAFGNNVTGSLHPSDPSPILPPTDITLATGCSEVVWHSWECTLGRGVNGLKAWGSVPAQLETLLATGVDPVRFIGHDTPEGYLGTDGRVYALDGSHSVRKWDDVAMTGLDEVFALADNTIFRFPSLDNIIKDEKSEKKGEVRGRSISLHTLESRCFVRVDDHLFELKDKLKLVDDLEGLGVRVFEGRRNRLGVVTDAGDAFVFDSKAVEPTLIELDVEEDVRLLGLGSEFDVVVTETKVMARGDNVFGQLGCEGQTDGWVEVNVKAAEVVDIVCSRWGTIVLCQDE